MKIVVQRTGGKTPGPARRPGQPNPYDKRYGAWGHVADTDGDEKAAYSGDNSVDVVLDMGVHLRHVPVASFEWVVNKTVSGKDYTTGQRDLPPPNARVFIMMPAGAFDDCFVLCSGFSPVEKNDNAPFSDDDTEKIRERVKQGGWHTIYDCRTGAYEAVSPDGKTSMKIDYGTGEGEKEHPELHLKLFEKTTLDIIDEDSASLSVFDGEARVEHKKGDSAKITVFDTELVIKQGEVSIKPKKTTIEVDGDATIRANGKTEIEADGDTSVKGNNVTVEAAVLAEVKGAQVKISGTVVPGMGPFCALPNCLFTGAPHGGNTAAGV
jgi:hypothetical protein